MNEDIYAEWLVQKKPSKLVPLIYIAGALFTAISIYLMITTAWGFIAFIICAFVVFIGRRYLSVEYEYVFVTSSLTIDRIFSQAVRKTAVEIEMESVETVEKSSGNKEQLLQGTGVTYEDFTTHYDEDEVWMIVYTNEKKGRCLLEFCPNEKVLKAMWRCSPMKVHLNQ